MIVLGSAEDAERAVQDGRSRIDVPRAVAAC